MASRTQVEAWQELANTAQREYPGWWVRIEDQLRPARRNPMATRARVSVSAHVVASHESVPALCEMLERAMAIIARAKDEHGGQLDVADADAAALLREWRGEAPDRAAG